MSDMVIPCEVITRAARLLTDEKFPTIRLEKGCVIATNGQLMMVEKVGQWDGGVNFYPHPDLLRQCETETQFSGSLTITYNSMLSFMTAKTTFGYVHPTNLLGQPGEIDRWKEIAERCTEPSMTSVGAMFWNCDALKLLSSVAPSGCIVFEEHIDLNKPVMVCDKEDRNWFGFFNGYAKDETPAPASYPAWLR